MWTKNYEKFNRKNGESRNSYRVKVVGVGVKGMVTLPKVGALVWDWRNGYGVATISLLLKIIGLQCKRAQKKRLYSAKETYNFKEPTNRSHPIASIVLPVLPPDLKVLQPATARCGPIRDFEGGSFRTITPSIPKPVWNTNCYKSGHIVFKP